MTLTCWLHDKSTELHALVIFFSLVIQNCTSEADITKKNKNKNKENNYVSICPFPFYIYYWLNIRVAKRIW